MISIAEKIISLIMAFIVSCGIHLPVINNGTNIYVDAVNGCDDFSGTASFPVKTITKALELTNENKKTVYILNGKFNETVTVDKEGVTIEGDKNSDITITGGSPVENSWENYKGHIYKTYLRDKVESVFVGSEQMITARWPDTSPFNLCKMNRAKTDSGTDSTVLFDSSLPDIDLTGAHLTIWAGSGWLTFNRIINSCNKGKSVSWETPIKSAVEDNPESMDCYVPHKGNYYYISNSLDLLNRPCEWYYDDETSMLYFYAPNGKNPAESDVTVKVRKQGLNVNADNVTVKNINVFGCGVICNGNNCILDGVNLKCADYFTDSDYFDQYNHRNVVISGNGNVWKNSEISDTWGDGIYISGNENTVENCHIHDVCYAGSYFGGVTVTGDSDSIINCTLHDSGRYNIIHSAASKIKIIGCEMYHSALLSFDCGSTYTWGTDGKGSEIAYNYYHDNREVALYIDNNCSDFYIHDNVIINNGTGITMNSQMLDCVIENNILLKNDKMSSTYYYEKDGPSMKGSVIKGNTYTGTWNIVNGENAPKLIDNKKVKTSIGVKLPDRQYGCNFK